MKIIEKIMKKQADRYNQKSVTIVCVGDSVTEGCFNDYVNEEGRIVSAFQRNYAYAERLKELFSLLFPTVQINVINSGFSGGWACNCVVNLERDVLSFSPDLVIVSFGLNDSEGGVNGLEDYANSLALFFDKIKARGSEVIFLTENYMCTKISHEITEPSLIKVAKSLCERQNTGILKNYFEKAKEVCKKNDVVICDLYNVWEQMQNSGVNVDGLLSNQLNHPIKEYHYYIAIKLLEKILGLN